MPGRFRCRRRGVALEDGGLGETVRVQNPSSKAVVMATVTGGGEVRGAGTTRHAAGRRAMSKNNVAPFVALLGLAGIWALSGCGSFEKLGEIGKPPAMTPTANPTQAPSWRPVTMPMPTAAPPPSETASLWRNGSRAFFKDQRAAQVGDIVTVLVKTTDTADVENASTETKNGSESMGVPNMFGLEGKPAAHTWQGSECGEPGECQ